MHFQTRSHARREELRVVSDRPWLLPYTPCILRPARERTDQNRRCHAGRNVSNLVFHDTSNRLLQRRPERWENDHRHDVHLAERIAGEGTTPLQYLSTPDSVRCEAVQSRRHNFQSQQILIARKQEPWQFKSMPHRCVGPTRVSESRFPTSVVTVRPSRSLTMPPILRSERHQSFRRRVEIRMLFRA